MEITFPILINGEIAYNAQDAIKIVYGHYPSVHFFQDAVLPTYHAVAFVNDPKTNRQTHITVASGEDEEIVMENALEWLNDPVHAPNNLNVLSLTVSRKPESFVIQVDKRQIGYGTSMPYAMQDALTNALRVAERSGGWCELKAVNDGE